MQTDKSPILLVIVNYNQELEIENFLTSLIHHWDRQHAVLVDDGSSDSSPATAERLGYKVVRHTQNSGVGAAIRTGIEHAKRNGYESVLIMSSNGKMVPSEIPQIVTPIIQNTADYVTGSRFLAGGNSPGLSNFRKLSIPVFSLISTFLLGRKFSDITCGFRCYRISFLFDNTCNIHQDWLSRYELEYYIHYWACRRNLRISEVPVTIKYSHLAKNRSSKIRPIIDWWSMIRPLILLRLSLKK
ncbi:glycosyltransferase family 2 protein [Bdellovibrio sp. HCB290]|uniref:glycosyltransferase family 2 protein n=1 Tax=Bdellovibrio sp. HCB290 TaxID=3394356 RepID=UPI0039B39F96